MGEIIQLFNGNNVSIIGTGYVGLVGIGHEYHMYVCGGTQNQKFEGWGHPNLGTRSGADRRKNYNLCRLRFTTDVFETVNNSTTIFIADGTPPRGDGSANGQSVLAAAISIAEYMNEYEVIVIKVQFL